MTAPRVFPVIVLAGILATTATGAAHRTLVVTVKSVQTFATADDVPPKGLTSGGKPSAGDIIVVHDNLFNRAPQFGKPTGARIGTDVSKLTFVSSTRAEVVGAAKLPGGGVSFKGRFSTRVGIVSLTITGGGGRYAGARGTVSEPASDRNAQNATNVYHLILP